MAGILDALLPGLGTGISLAGDIASGISELVTANKQKNQAQNLNQQALSLPVEPLRPEFKQRLLSDQMAAAGGLPGLNLAKQELANNAANQLRAIRESSPNGAAALGAISAISGQQNEASNKLDLQNAGYMADEGKAAREDLWNIGTQQRALEIYRNQERDKMLQQVNALQNSATANKQTAINTITGGITSSGAALTSNANTSNNNAWLNQYYPGNVSNGIVGATGLDANGYPVTAAPAGTLPELPSYNMNSTQPYGAMLWSGQ